MPLVADRFLKRAERGAAVGVDLTGEFRNRSRRRGAGGKYLQLAHRALTLSPCSIDQTLVEPKAERANESARCVSTKGRASEDAPPVTSSPVEALPAAQLLYACAA